MDKTEQAMLATVSYGMVAAVMGIFAGLGIWSLATTPLYHPAMPVAFASVCVFLPACLGSIWASVHCWQLI